MDLAKAYDHVYEHREKLLQIMTKLTTISKEYIDIPEFETQRDELEFWLSDEGTKALHRLGSE